MGRSRPEPGLGRGAVLTLGDVTPGSMATSKVPRRNQVLLLGRNQHLSRPLGRLLRGGWTPHAVPFSGLAWSSRYSQSDTRARGARERARPEPGLGRGAGRTFGDVTPGSMASARVHRHNQVRLLGSILETSRPLGRLLRGGWTPHAALFGRSVVEQVQPIRTPGQLC